jgi:hypothetical protein
MGSEGCASMLDPLTWLGTYCGHRWRVTLAEIKCIQLRMTEYSSI